MKLKSVLFGVYLLVFFLLCFAEKSYSRCQVYEAFAKDQKNLRFLETAEKAHMLTILEKTPGGPCNASTSFCVKPGRVNEIKLIMDQRRIEYHVISEDLQRDTDKRPEVEGMTDNWFSSYHNFSEILTWLKKQVDRCGSLCSLIDVGTSYEGRPLRAIKITGKKNCCEQKPSIWIDAGIHSREWIAITTAMFLIDKLITNYTSDPVIRDLRYTKTWYILPVVNPDGYEYTWTDDRMWFKSRQPNLNSTCNGTDINRNFDYQWNTIEDSTDPCSDTYAGPRPFSEPEAKAVADFVLKLNGTWDLFWTLHTYGQLYLSPWGYTTDWHPNYDAMERVGEAAVQAIYNVHGKNYTYGNAANVLYLASGSSRDWAAGIAKIPFSYTPHLRDKNGSVLPPSQIIPTGEEIWAGLIETVKQIQVEKPPICFNLKKN